MTCRTGFERWVTNHSNFSSLTVHKLLAKYNSPVTPREGYRPHEWPGFFQDDNTWIKPELRLSCPSEIDVGEETILLDQLVLHGLLPQDGQQ